MKLYHEREQYEITHTFPGGYLVWAIGEEHAPAGHLPLCRLLPADLQPFEGGRSIDTKSLLALPVSDEVRRVALRKAIKRDVDREEFEAIQKIVEMSESLKRNERKETK